MRLAVLSDIHGNIAALDAVLDDLSGLGGADHIWFLGDHAAFGPRPAEVIRRIKGLLDSVADDEAKRHTIRAIRGNTDRYLVYGQRPRFPAAKDAEAFDKLRGDLRDFSDRIHWCLDQLRFTDYEVLHKLHGEIDLNVEGYGYVIGYHAVPGDDEAYELTPDSSDEVAADALLDREGRLGIGGHIHVQMDRTIPMNGWRVINVGSVGVSFDMAGRAQYGVFTFEDGDVQVDLRAVPFDVEAVIADSRERGNPATDWLAGKLRGTA